MSNSFGSRFKLTTFGESHGTALGGIVDGCPAGLLYDAIFMEEEMQRRHIGTHATSRLETDHVEILSGIFNNRTLGSPIAFCIRNEKQQSNDYDNLKHFFRPGHADFTSWKRYGLRDYRGGGRASGRETAARVAGGAFAKMFLQEQNISISSQYIETLKVTNDNSVGGIISCLVNGVPPGIGNPCFDKLNARLAFAMMSIPSATGFEMGLGFEATQLTGRQYRDEWTDNFYTTTNHCGGVQGGISNGMPISFRVAFHAPVTTTTGSTECIDETGNICSVSVSGRHDHCHVPRTAVVVEAMAALVLADLILDK